MKNNTFAYTFSSPLQVTHGGFFISRGKGMHPERTIATHELIYVDRGILGMFEDEKTFTVKEGEYLHLFPGKKHGGTLPYEKDLRFYWIHFIVTDTNRTPKKDPIIIPQHQAAKRPERLVELYRQYLEDQEEGIKNQESINLLLLQILVEAGSRGPEQAEESSHLVTQAEIFITTHFHENISTVDIAHDLNVNPDYLGRVFKRVSGRTITDTIHTRRLSFARNLLLHSAENINEIAYESGFRDPGYFRRLFKRKMRMTPAQYRKMYTKININTE